MHRAEVSWQGALERLAEGGGREVSLGELAQRLYHVISGLRAPAVGAVHVTCADECEIECAEAFQKGFVQYLLPRLKFSHQSPFRLANLGGRYERGAVPIAEAHYAGVVPDGAYKVMVVKLNAHCSVEEGTDGPRFGKLLRYRAESDYCGALHGLLAGDHLPVHDDLAELFGPERLATLRDRNRIPAHERMLHAAVVMARLQAGLAVQDIQEHEPRSPTLYFVLPCVSLNRPQRDTELLVGVYVLDRTGTPVAAGDRYAGLGDEPAAYRIASPGAGPITVTDDQLGHPREVRDHRRPG